jgi:hypothetical protein
LSSRRKPEPMPHVSSHYDCTTGQKENQLFVLKKAFNGGDAKHFMDMNKPAEAALSGGENARDGGLWRREKNSAGRRKERRGAEKRGGAPKREAGRRKERRWTETQASRGTTSSRAAEMPAPPSKLCNAGGGFRYDLSLNHGTPHAMISHREQIPAISKGEKR